MTEIEGELEFRALLWDEASRSWKEIPWSAHGAVALEGAKAGDHRFVICVMEAGELYNIIPRRVITDDNGVIIRGVDGLSDRERKEYGRLMVKPTLTKREDARIDSLRKKMSAQFDLPQDLKELLVRFLPGPPASIDSAGISNLEIEYGILRNSKTVH